MIKECLVTCPECKNSDKDENWNDATVIRFGTFNIAKISDGDASECLFVCPSCLKEVGGDRLIIETEWR